VRTAVDYVVDLEHVTAGYQDLVAIEDVTFRVAAGEFVALIGPNGSGKTTLVKAILGLVKPTSGTVRLFGRPPQQLDGDWKRVGYVAQIAQIDPRFPIRVLEVGLFFKELLFITFDPEMAQISGLPAGALYVLLLSLMALTIVLSIKVVGIILVSALIVIPDAAAYQLTEDFRRMMLVAVVISNLSATIGLLLSYGLDTASGAIMVLTATTLFILSAFLSPRRRRR